MGDSTKRLLTALRAVGGCASTAALKNVAQLSKDAVNAAIRTAAAHTPPLIENAARGQWRITQTGLNALASGNVLKKTGCSTTATQQQTRGATGIRRAAWNALRIKGIWPCFGSRPHSKRFFRALR